MEAVRLPQAGGEKGKMGGDGGRSMVVKARGARDEAHRSLKRFPR